MSLEGPKVSSGDERSQQENKIFKDYIADVTESGKRAEVTEFTKGEAKDFVNNEWRATNEASLAGEGKDVNWLQKKLQAKGYYKGTIDGKFGVQCLAGLCNMQRDTGMTHVDGIAGANVVAYLSTGEKQAKTEQKETRGNDPFAAEARAVSTNNNRERNSEVPNFDIKAAESDLKRGYGGLFNNSNTKKILEIASKLGVKNTPKSIVTAIAELQHKNGLQVNGFLRREERILAGISHGGRTVRDDDPWVNPKTGNARPNINIGGIYF